MSVFVPIPDTARVVMRWVQHTDERVNVLHYKRAGGWTQPQLQDLASFVMEVWKDNLRLVLANTISILDVSATDISVENGVQALVSCATDCTGGIAQASAPANATSTISWRTGRTGRRYRGRTYPAGYLDGHINDDSTIQSQLLLSLLQYAGNLAFNVPHAGLLAVASKIVQAAEPVLTSVLENVLDTQRRRLPKRGR